MLYAPKDKTTKHDAILGKIGKPTSNPDVKMKSAINAPPQLLDVRSHAIHGPLNYLRLSSCVILGGRGGASKYNGPSALVYTSRVYSSESLFIHFSQLGCTLRA